MNLESKKSILPVRVIYQFRHCDEDYQKISEIDLTGPNDRFRAKWPRIMFYQQFLQFLIIFELFILFKFQGDQMCLKKVLKMAIMALTGYVEKFFVNSEVKVEINDENYT